MKATIIRNGRIIDPANGRDEVGDLLIVDGKIQEGMTASKARQLLYEHRPDLKKERAFTRERWLGHSRAGRRIARDLRVVRCAAELLKRHGMAFAGLREIVAL